MANLGTALILVAGGISGIYLLFRHVIYRRVFPRWIVHAYSALTIPVLIVACALIVLSA